MEEELVEEVANVTNSTEEIIEEEELEEEQEIANRTETVSVEQLEEFVEGAESQDFVAFLGESFKLPENKPEVVKSDYVPTPPRAKMKPSDVDGGT